MIRLNDQARNDVELRIAELFFYFLWSNAKAPSRADY